MIPDLIPHKAGQIPLAAEFPVDVLTAPYLVTGSAQMVWVEDSVGGVVRAGVRRSNLIRTYKDILVRVAARGKRDGWENVFPMTVKGIKAAVQHLFSYGIPEVEILLSGGCPILGRLQEEDDLEHRVVVTDWLRKDQGVVVPIDRNFLGVASSIGEKHCIGIIHNPSRGMAVIELARKSRKGKAPPNARS